jgi:hypothetical protein
MRQRLAACLDTILRHASGLAGFFSWAGQYQGADPAHKYKRTHPVISNFV